MIQKRKSLVLPLILSLLVGFSSGVLAAEKEPKFTNPNLTFKPMSPEEEARLAPIKLGQPPVLDAKQQKKVDKGDVVIVDMTKSDTDDKGPKRYLAIGMVDAAPKAIMSFLRDYPNRVGRMPHIAEVSAEWEKNLARVNMTLKIALTKLRYRMQYLHYVDSMVEWEYIHGDIKDSKGYFKCFPREDGKKTLLVYHVQTETGMSVPKFILEMLTKHSMPKVIKAVRAAVKELAEKVQVEK